MTGEIGDRIGTSNGLELVTLVDRDDRRVGTAEKMRAHREGLLHRACSVVLFNPQGEMLLQRRNPDKYHSGGRWSNTCCTHPRPDEPVAAAAVRRLREEMGIEAELEPVFEFVYRAEMEGGLIEHEYDHVFVGSSDAAPRPDEEEVVDWRWASVADVAADLERSPSDYSAWFPLLFERLRAVR